MTEDKNKEYITINKMPYIWVLKCHDTATVPSLSVREKCSSVTDCTETTGTYEQLYNLYNNTNEYQESL
jgi:hypothetical protein